MLGLLPAEYWDYRFRDLVRGFASALLPRKSTDRIQIPGLGECVPARSARSAIVAAIKALNLAPGSGIGVPLYCCSVVFKAIEAAGYSPRFIDVDPTTFCVSAADVRAKRSEIEAIIAVHTFGHICDIPALQEALNGKPIIEDCAQALGSRVNGQSVGSLGDVAVFSFRSGKYLSVGEGGALFTKSPEIRLRAREIISEMPVPTGSAECLHVAKTYLRSMLRSKPLYGIAGYALWQRYNRAVRSSEKAPIVASQIFNGDLDLASRRLPRLDFEIKCQRSNAEFYIRNLDLDGSKLPLEKTGSFYNRYQFPLKFAEPRERDFIAKCLFHCRIDASRPMKDAAEVATVDFGYRGDCPVAEQLTNAVVLIPCYHSLLKREVEHIARSVNQALRELGGIQPRAEASAQASFEPRSWSAR